MAAKAGFGAGVLSLFKGKFTLNHMRKKTAAAVLFMVYNIHSCCVSDSTPITDVTAGGLTSDGKHLR